MKTDKNWQECLTPEQYRIMREKGTEQAFTGKFYNHHGTGSYVCAACGQELFSSDTKFDSGTGWPSFTKPADTKGVKELTDKSHGMSRTEVLCAKCDSHLGHKFDDGPAPTGQRYCINSVSLDFKDKATAAPTNATEQTITFGAGCFWCTEAAFESIDGVLSAESGYMGGSTKDPTYKEVCTGKTGHAEVTRVTYDPARVSLERIMDVFWTIHDPTTLNRQGADVGTQYRSAIFYYTDDQKAAAEKSSKEQEKKLGIKVVTEITKAADFFKAEDYHQDYYRNNTDAPYCRTVIAPKLKKLSK